MAATIKCQYDLFDKKVKPILLYGCEIWGFVNNDIIERIHLKFCKHLLNLKKIIAMKYKPLELLSCKNRSESFK
jgi:hypothetical protein